MNKREEKRVTEDGTIIRRMKAGEEDAVALIEKHVFPDPWTANSLLDMLSDPHSFYIVAERDGVIVGYCGSRTVLDEGDILRVAIEEIYRGAKIGSAMISFLIDSTPEIISWNLDVREHNAPAIGLYKKYGFIPIGRRRNYYHHPSEDAILMQRNSKGRE